jgi:transposase
MGDQNEDRDLRDLALALVDSGVSKDEAAKQLSVSRKAIDSWSKSADEEEISPRRAGQPRPRPGRPRQLSEKDLQSIAVWVSNPKQSWDYFDLSERIRSVTRGKVRYTLHHVRRIARKCGWKPRPSNHALLRRFVAAFRNYLVSLTSEDTTYLKDRVVGIRLVVNHPDITLPSPRRSRRRLGVFSSSGLIWRTHLAGILRAKREAGIDSLSQEVQKGLLMLEELLAATWLTRSDLKPTLRSIVARERTHTRIRNSDE